MAAKNQYRLEVRFGDDLLEAGFTAVPNLFLTNYHDLGISDGAALWIVHILRFKWTEDNPYPRRSSIPMNANRDTQQRYARELRKLGLLFTRRTYWSAQDNPPRPDLVGKIRALEYDFATLFHNVVRISRWKAEKHPLNEFQIEIPLEIKEKVATGYFHDVPKKWRLLCEQQIALTRGGSALSRSNVILSGSEEPEPKPRAERGGSEGAAKGSEELPCENHMVDPDQLPCENHMEALPCDFQVVENHPHYKEDSVFKKKHGSPEEKEQQQQNTWPPSAAVVAILSPNDLKSLHLQDDQAILDRDGTGSHFVVISISEAVQHELRQRRSDPFYEAEIYYSVEHALGEGPDDWTDEELARIRRKQALERELGERYQRIGAFTLEEALQQYFTPQFTAQILKDKPVSERERIEDWVAYVRRQKNLTNPAGFLRTSIESGETAPSSRRRAADDGLPLPALTAVGGRRATVPSEANPDPVPDLGIPGTDMTSQELWKAILDQLQFQMTRATFDTWLRDTHVARVGNDHLVIATPNPRAVEWLKLRLNPVICRTLAGLLGHAVTVEYEVADERG